MNDGFDKYADLLAIAPGARPPDYYTLLGVARSETDTARIHAAAKKRIAKLSSLLAGNRAKYATELMAEVATARAALTTPAVRARYDIKLREQQADNASAVPPTQPVDTSPPLPPAAVDAGALQQTVTMTIDPVAGSELPPPASLPPPSRWARTVQVPPALPDLPAAAPTLIKARLVAGPGTAFEAPTPTVNLQGAGPPEECPPLPQAAMTDAPAHWSEASWSASAEPGAPFMAGHRATTRAARPKRSQASLIVALGFALFAVGVVGGGAIVWQLNHTSLAERDGGEAAKAAFDSRPRQESVADVRTKAGAPDGAPPAPRGSQARSVSGGADRSLRSDSSVVLRPGVPGQAGKEPSASGAENPMPTVKPSAAGASEMEKPALVKAAEHANVDPVRGEAVRNSLAAARKALAARDLDKAEEQIDLARLDASAESLRTKVEGVNTLRHFVGGFLNAVRQSMESLQSTSELEVDGDLVSVVEIDLKQEQIVVRMKGQNQHYDANRLPTNLAVALADRWLDKGDRNRTVFIGAYLITSAENEDIERGKQMLAKAKSEGVEAADAVLAAYDR